MNTPIAGGESVVVPFRGATGVSAAGDPRWEWQPVFAVTAAVAHGNAQPVMLTFIRGWFEEFLTLEQARALAGALLSAVREIEKENH